MLEQKNDQRSRDPVNRNYMRHARPRRRRPLTAISTPQKPYHRADAKESVADLLLQSFRERGASASWQSKRPFKRRRLGGLRVETLDKSAGFCYPRRHRGGPS